MCVCVTKTICNDYCIRDIKSDMIKVGCRTFNAIILRIKLELY